MFGIERDHRNAEPFNLKGYVVERFAVFDHLADGFGQVDGRDARQPERRKTLIATLHACLTDRVAAPLFSCQPCVRPADRRQRLSCEVIQAVAGVQCPHDFCGFRSPPAGDPPRHERAYSAHAG